MTKNLSSRDWEALSAYLDDHLSTKERARLEARLQSSPELKSGLDELRATRAVLRSQPKLRARRNFTLTPEMVGVKRPTRAYPVMRLAAVLVSIMFVLVFVGDIIFGGTMGGVPQMASEQRAETLMDVISVEKEGEGAIEMFAEEPPEAPAEQAEAEESARVEEIESSKSLAPTLARPSGESAAGDVSAVDQATSTQVGTPQPGADVLALPMIIDDAEGGELTAGAAETAADEVTPAEQPSWLSQITSTLTTIRVLEILIGLLAVGMWVGVWILYRR